VWCMTNIDPEYMRVLADDVQHTVDNGYEFGPENVVATLRAAADEIDRLRTLIEDAPHSNWCATTDNRRVYEFPPCNCWKAQL
jgi:hypothetical protein